MKPLVIYHADCTDGYAAAFAAWLKLGDEAEYLPMQYGRDFSKSEGLEWLNPLNLGGREVCVLDFSFPRNVMDFLFTNAKRVVWLDHHKTAFEMWGLDPRITFAEIGPSVKGNYKLLDNNKSGAMLSWEYFHPAAEVPQLFRLIDDRDRWQFKLEGSKELHAALQSHKPWTFQQWHYWYSNDCEAELIVEGAALLRAQQQHVTDMAKQARKCRIKHGPDQFDQSYSDGLSINAPLHMSELGHELANQSGTFALVWYVGADNKVKCSLRSNAPYDVSAIAKAFGGGGHAQAAGFETDIGTLMGWLK